MGNQEKPRIALVIGSGGIKCAAAIGMWRVLQEENISIDSVVGCSGGSMYGALIAKREDVNTMQELSKTFVDQRYYARLHRQFESQQRWNSAIQRTQWSGG